MNRFQLEDSKPYLSLTEAERDRIISFYHWCYRIKEKGYF